MKLLSYQAEGKECYGALKEDGIVDLSRRLDTRFQTLRELLAGNGLPRAAEIAAGAASDHRLGDVKLRRTIPFPEKIICVGINYAKRNAEYRDGSEPAKRPSLFSRFPGSLVPHGERILRPPESQQLDYEGEIAVVIGKKGRRIPAAHALEHIAGLTIMNEGTIRDWLRHGKFNVTQGKNFDRSGALGPWMVTIDEFRSLDDIQIQTRVNGEIRQNDTTANLIFSIPELLNYISTFTELVPGDVIATGTPTGAGARFDPPRYLVPGDCVEIEVRGIGVLSNTIADET
jgi:5-carboxymethyl-2-hydroxymuconate isomerase